MYIQECQWDMEEDIFFRVKHDSLGTFDLSKPHLHGTAKNAPSLPLLICLLSCICPSSLPFLILSTSGCPSGLPGSVWKHIMCVRSQFCREVTTELPVSLCHLTPASVVSSSAESRGVPDDPPPTLDVTQPAAVAVSANHSGLHIQWRSQLSLCVSYPFKARSGSGPFAKSRPHHTDDWPNCLERPRKVQDWHMGEYWVQQLSTSYHSFVLFLFQKKTQKKKAPKLKVRRQMLILAQQI